MAWILLISFLTISMQLACWSTGQCNFLCPRVGLFGCFGVAAVAAAVLFTMLTFIREMSALDSLRD